MARNKISAAVYHGHIKGKHEQSQNRQVLAYLREIDQPQNIRMLHRIMNARGYAIDLVSLRRSITNLHLPDPKGKWHNEWNKAMIKVAFDKQCPITRKTVAWFIPVNTTVQFDLFANQKQEAA